jgi:lambda repressor-like predicted transcriptional regulator
MVSLARWGFVARRTLRNALIRYRRLTPGGLARDLLRARILRRESISPRRRAPRPERIVVSLTSIPDRAGLIGPALRSLLDQTCPADRIVLAWPRRSLRTGAAYPPPLDAPPGVDVLQCDDVGPATKLLPTLLEEPDALIVVVDDDVIYPFDFIETLLNAHRADPRAALGYRGWRLKPGVDPRDLDHVFATALKRPEDVDILFGTWGYLLPAGALDAAAHDFEGYPPETRWVDDVWISGHLARLGVPRRVIPARALPLESKAAFVGALTDGLNRSGDNDRIAIAAFEPWR